VLDPCPLGNFRWLDRPEHRLELAVAVAVLSRFLAATRQAQDYRSNPKPADEPSTAGTIRA
jgi:hypothetical protein